MPLPIDSRIFWPGTIASIPSGFSRDTDFYGKYLQHSATAGTNGGSATHAHTADTHTHTQQSHTHTLTMSGTPDNTANPASVGSNMYATGDHTHPDKESAAKVATNQNTVVTINAATADPPYYEMILLKPSSAYELVPSGAIGFAENELDGFYLCDGDNGTPDLDGLFLKIADDDDGGATGGSATHTHTSPAHTHTQDAHTHDTSDFGDASAMGFLVGSAVKGTIMNKIAAHHTARSISSVAAVNQSTAITVDAVANLPAYIDLLAIQAANDSEPKVGLILPFVGSTVPNGWQSYDAGNKQVRCVVDIGDVGGTGGANTHTHTTQDHTHVQNTHVHTYTLTNTTFIEGISSAGAVAAVGNHSHTGGHSMASTAAVNNDAEVTMSTDDIRLPYRTVQYIQKLAYPDYIIRARRRFKV